MYALQSSSGLQIKVIAVHVHLYDTWASAVSCMLNVQVKETATTHLQHSKTVKNAKSLAEIWRNRAAGLSAFKVIFIVVNGMCFGSFMQFLLYSNITPGTCSYFN